MQKIAVIPTDTLYGLVAPALDEQAVLRIYELKGRNPEKPCIILVHSIADLSRFGITPTEPQARFLEAMWPGPVSVILGCAGDRFAYLHRGTHSLAFRIPAKESVRAFIKESGPLIAPSANPEGMPYAKSIREAQAYFGDRVGEYIDGGELSGEPSTLVDFSGDRPIVLREGRGTIPVNEL